MWSNWYLHRCGFFECRFGILIGGILMKVEKNIKNIISIPVCELIGIFVGIFVANATGNNIGIGIGLGMAIGYFVGSVIGLFISKVSKHNK